MGRGCDFPCAGVFIDRIFQKQAPWYYPESVAFGTDPGRLQRRVGSCCGRGIVPLCTGNDAGGSIRSVKELTQIQALRWTLNQRLLTFFQKFDLLLTPTMPSEPFAAEGPPPDIIGGQPIPLLGAVAFTYPFNLSGHPAASVPAGFTENGLPVRLQIVGACHADDLVLQAARAYEKMRPWNDQWPVL